MKRSLWPSDAKRHEKGKGKVIRTQWGGAVKDEKLKRTTTNPWTYMKQLSFNHSGCISTSSGLRTKHQSAKKGNNHHQPSMFLIFMFKIIPWCVVAGAVLLIGYTLSLTKSMTQSRGSCFPWSRNWANSFEKWLQFRRKTSYMRGL